MSICHGSLTFLALLEKYIKINRHYLQLVQVFAFPKPPYALFTIAQYTLTLYIVFRCGDRRIWLCYVSRINYYSAKEDNQNNLFRFSYWCSFQKTGDFKILWHSYLWIFFKEVYFLFIFVICLILQTRYKRIIQEIPNFFIYCRKFSMRFQGPKLFNSLSREIQNSESISLFGKSQIYSLLSYIRFFFLSFSLLFGIIHFLFSTLNSHGVPYIVRKPIQ